nr:MAG TPA: hypothetical protein [Caudoviricetes sp.]
MANKVLPGRIGDRASDPMQCVYVERGVAGGMSRDG